MSALHCYHCGGEARFNANGVWYCAPCGKSPESTCTCPPLAERSPVPHLPAKAACESAANSRRLPARLSAASATRTRTGQTPGTLSTRRRAALAALSADDGRRTVRGRGARMERTLLGCHLDAGDVARDAALCGDLRDPGRAGARMAQRCPAELERKMSDELGWHFTDGDVTAYDARPIVVGETLRVSGKIIPCERGLHASPSVFDACDTRQGRFFGGCG